MKRVVVVLEVIYDTDSDEKAVDLCNGLDGAITRLVGNGGLTCGAPEVEVEHHEAEFTVEDY